MRNAISEIAATTDSWSGIPMPLNDERLVLEPRYPKAAELMAMGRKEEPEPDNDGAVIRNSWFSDWHRADILIWNEKDGSLHWGKVPKPHHIGMDLSTLGCSVAWGIEQESNAVHLLGTLLRHHQFKQYLLTGMFLEKSKRSGVTYIFRRLKPTIALDARPGGKPSEMPRILACLCMHPIGHYAGTWAGAMCPTDDVVAHLMLMRGDEHGYWKRANQIPPISPLAGL